MRDTIARIDHSPRQILIAQVIDVIALLVGLADLCVESQRSLHTNEETLYVESLEHDLSDLFTVFRSVHRWLSKDEAVVLGLALQVVMN